jgi:DNA-binding SARP family transcriptional activator
VADIRPQPATDRLQQWSVDFRLLGVIEIVLPGNNLVEIGSARERVILTMLLLRANRVVQVEQLIDAVWDESPPATARSQVQQCVSALRRKLAQAGGGLLMTDAAGYVIRVPGDAIDVTRFERLVLRSRIAVTEDRIADAAADLRAALALWRGPACAGVDSSVIRAAATRLDEDRLAALETCADLDLQLGRHRELAGELGGLVAQYPLRERLRYLYMVALYRSGDKATALEAFRSARVALVAELGLEPGDELSALNRGILAGDPALDHGPDTIPGTARLDLGTVPVPRQLPSAIADFTGRGQEVSELTMLLSVPDEAMLAGRYLPMAVLRGKGGVGKTTLALHAAHALRHDYPDGHLYAQLRDGDGHPVSAADVLSLFLRALGLPSAAIPEGLAERAATYRSLVGDRRVLILLDDAHVTSQVVPLIPGNPGCGVIITSRDSLAGLDGAHYIDIGDLDEAASLRLLGAVIGSDRVAEEPAAALSLVRMCGCLPLALRIVAARLVARPHWKLEAMVGRLADEERRLDELALGDVGIRATVALSYETLDQDAGQLFRLLGLLGSADFSAWVAAPLLGCDAARAVELLDTLVDARLVDVHVNGAGVARFRLHELVRVYARERLAAEESAARRTAALERMLGCWLMLASEAHRRTYGGDFAILHRSASRFPLPADLIDELLASPLDWLRIEQSGLVSAVYQAAQTGLHELCWDLAMTLMTLFESDYQADNWRRTHDVALAAARRGGNRMGEAAMLYSLGHLEVLDAILFERPGAGWRHSA